MANALLIMRRTAVLGSSVNHRSIVPRYNQVVAMATSAVLAERSPNSTTSANRLTQIRSILANSPWSETAIYDRIAALFENWKIIDEWQEEVADIARNYARSCWPEPYPPMPLDLREEIDRHHRNIEGLYAETQQMIEETFHRS